jgi:phage gp29-like protein
MAGRPKKQDLSNELYTRATAWDATQYIGALPDEDVILTKLGMSAEDAFERIEADDHLTAVRNKRLGKLLALDWDLVRDKASATAYREVKAMLSDMDIRQFATDVMLARFWGASPIEAVWDTAGKYWAVKELLARPPRWFEFNNDNELVFKETYLAGKPVPDYKLLYCVNEPTYDNPYGVKLFSRLYWPITFKLNAWKWWNQALEGASKPFLYALVPPNTSETEKRKVVSMLKSMLKNSVGTVPNDSSVEYKDVKNSSSMHEIFKSFNSAMDAAISKIVLGGTLTTEMGSVGSYGAAAIHETGEDSLVQSDARMVCKYMDMLISWIMHFNFPGAQPRFLMHNPFKESKELAERDEILSRLGVKFTAEYFSEHHGLDTAQFTVQLCHRPRAQSRRSQRRSRKRRQTRKNSPTKQNFPFPSPLKKRWKQ